MGEYKRPGFQTFVVKIPHSNYLDTHICRNMSVKPLLVENKRGKAADIAWTMHCDVEYLIEEMNSKSITFQKHMIDMMLKHIHRESYDIWTLINQHLEEKDE